MSAIGKTARAFSAAGPCLTLGRIVRETPTQWVLERDGKQRRIKKGAENDDGLTHAEPCPSCTDHPKTQYPHGYMD